MHKGNFIHIEATGQHLFNKNLTENVDAQILRTTAITSTFYLLDMVNVWNASHTLSSDKRDAQSKRNIADFAGSTMGLMSSTTDAWETLHKAKVYQTRAEQQATVFVKTFGTGVGASNAMRMSFFKVLPSFAAFAGIGVAIWDYNKASANDDDFQYVHLMMIASGGIGFFGLFFASAILGPVALGIAVVATVLQYTVWKEDNLLDTWMSKGPFSEENNRWTPVLRPLYDYRRPQYATTGIQNIEKHTAWLSGTHVGIGNTLTDKNNRNRKRKVLSVPLKLCGHNLILDQNYKLLGYHVYQRGHYDYTLIFDDITGVIGITGSNGDSAVLGTVGQSMGATSWEACDKIRDKLEQLTPGLALSDISVRTDDGAGDEDKFIEPMRNDPTAGAASLELLLNGLYPLQAEFKLEPVSKTQTGYTNGRIPMPTYDYSGNRAVITVDLPYFIEGLSEVLVELRVDREGKDSRKNMPIIQIGNSATFKLTNLSELPIHEDSKGSGIYKCSKKTTPQIKIVVDFDHSSFEDDKHKARYAQQYNNRLDFECWIKINTNGKEKNEETIFMPWRGSDIWQQPESLQSNKAKDNSWLILSDSITLRKL